MKIDIAKAFIVVACIIGASIVPSITSAKDKIDVEILKDTTKFKIDINKNDFTGVCFSLSIADNLIDNIEIDEDNSKIFHKLCCSGTGHTAEYGKPELPTISFYVAVPQNADVQLSYNIEDYSILRDMDYNIYPAQHQKLDGEGYIDPPFVINDSFYDANEYYPSSIAEISSITIMRGCRIAMITVYPLLYNPVEKTMKFYKDIDIVIDFINGTEEFIHERYRSIYFQPILDSFLINANCIERYDYRLSGCSTGKSDDNRADLLIVVHDEFYDEILPLAEWRHQSGIETKIVKFSEISTSSDITQQSEDFRNYMSDAYYNWEVPPSFLLIVGDADHVPVNYLYEHPYWYYPDDTYTGTDHWYVAIDGDDYLPDIHAGRISIDDEDELNIVVNKILEYTKNPYMDDNWFDNVLLAAKEESGRFFVSTSELIYDYLNINGYTCDRIYKYHPIYDGSTEDVIESINNGAVIVNHRDHGSSHNYAGSGSYTGWSEPRFTTDNIIDDLENEHMYPVMFSINCESGWFDGETDNIEDKNYESIGEVGIRSENKGFVAVIAATRGSYSGYNDELCRGFYDAMFSDFDPDYPNGESENPYDTEVFKISQILNYGRFWTYDKYIVPGGCDPYPWFPDEISSRVTFEAFHVHGDPTMEIWTEFPQNIDVTHPESVPLEPFCMVVTANDDEGYPIEGALVCIYQDIDNGIYSRETTDASGNAYFYFDLSIIHKIIITVTGHNYLPYSSTIFVEHPEDNEPPITPGPPIGIIDGIIDTEYEYTATTIDPDDDLIWYNFSWGNGEFSGWIGPFESYQYAIAEYAWSIGGNYEVRVNAIDDPSGDGDYFDGIESGWSEPLSVHIDSPPTIPIITGPTSSAIGKICSYTFMSTDDNDDDMIYYNIDWGDGTDPSIIGPYHSGHDATINHIFYYDQDEHTSYLYTVAVKATDGYLESEWNYSNMKTARIGDMNTDGWVTFQDINPFVLAISDPDEYESEYEFSADASGDVNQDGAANIADVSSFLSLINGGRILIVNILEGEGLVTIYPYESVYSSPIEVTLEAIEIHPNWHFDHWIGDDIPSGHVYDNPLLITVSAYTVVNAIYNFGPDMEWIE